MAAATPSLMLQLCLFLLCLLLSSPTASLAHPEAHDSQALADLERAVQVLYNHMGALPPQFLTAEDVAAIRARRSKHGNRKLIQSCGKPDISIFQGHAGPSPSGIPTFIVQISNLCVLDCSISDVHISCGSFSSANLVSPTTFRRISDDDCLVNDGNPIQAGQILYFQYSNSFEYPLKVKYARGCNL